MSEPIKADVKTNLAVATLAGIDGAHLGTRCRAPFGSREAADYYQVCYVPDDDCPGAMKEWSPTTNPADAMKAAEAVGLFDPAKHNMQYWERRDGTCRVGYFLTGRAKTGATFCLAICEAILAIAKAKKADLAAEGEGSWPDAELKRIRERRKWRN